MTTPTLGYSEYNNDDELNEIIEYIGSEINQLADSRNCFLDLFSKKWRKPSPINGGDISRKLA